MERKRAKLANDSIRTYHYNTRSSSRHESRGISNTDRDAIVETESLRVTRRRKKISDDRRRSSDLLPIDLIMEIFKRLPVKTLARFLCVSKLWASIIRHRDFMKLFLAESSARPGRLFFTFKDEEECFIFSSLQTINQCDVASIATYHVTHPANVILINSSSVHGLICYPTPCACRLMVYNSSTGRSITLPELDYVIQHFLGYDPIDGVYKVLCMTGPRFNFHVLTLENENSWKMIEKTHSHLPISSQICINGIVYYEAYAGTELKEISIMSFDVRSEKFDLIKAPGGTDNPLGRHLFDSVIRYEGKLATMSTEISADGSVVLWVLEDAVKHKWLKKLLVLPDSWKSFARPSSHLHEFYRFLNVTDAGELILAPLSVHPPPYYVLCYDPKRNSVRKVVIEGITEHNLLHCEKGQLRYLLYIFSTQVESLMFL